MLRMDAGTDGRTDGRPENSIPTTDKVCGVYNDIFIDFDFHLNHWKQIPLLHNTALIYAMREMYLLVSLRLSHL